MKILPYESFCMRTQSAVEQLALSPVHDTQQSALSLVHHIQQSAVSPVYDT
jgi:hypothetical protein